VTTNTNTCLYRYHVFLDKWLDGLEQRLLKHELSSHSSTLLLPQ